MKMKLNENSFFIIKCICAKFPVILHWLSELCSAIIILEAKYPHKKQRRQISAGK